MPLRRVDRVKKSRFWAEEEMLAKRMGRLSTITCGLVCAIKRERTNYRIVVLMVSQAPLRLRRQAYGL
jgi:hypothetical protein